MAGSPSNFPLMLASAATTVICWGAYGPILHKGQEAMGHGKLRPIIGVGVAYFIVAIVVPILLMWFGNWENESKYGWNISGIFWSLAGGAAGAIGALGIVMAFTYGGTPPTVMPLVFGFAPVVNVFTTLYLGRIFNKSYEAPNPMFFAGIILVGVGAFTVLKFQPKMIGGSGHGPAKPADAKHEEKKTEKETPLTPKPNEAEEKAEKSEKNDETK